MGLAGVVVWGSSARPHFPLCCDLVGSGWGWLIGFSIITGEPLHQKFISSQSLPCAAVAAVQRGGGAQTQPVGVKFAQMFSDDIENPTQKLAVTCRFMDFSHLWNTSHQIPAPLDTVLPGNCLLPTVFYMYI